MSLNPMGYQVGRSTGRCAETGRTLEPGSACVACLCEREHDEGLDRLDFSEEAWASGGRPPRLFSYWRTRVPEPAAARHLLVDDEVLLNLFERLGGDERPLRIAFRFVLGLILMRKRLVKYVGREGEGANERWLVTPRGASPQSPPLELVNPHLGDQDVRQISEQLGEILQAEL